MYFVVLYDSIKYNIIVIIKIVNVFLWSNLVFVHLSGIEN